MAALVEEMFSVREVPWHGLGTVVDTAPTSKEAIKLAGLDWKVHTHPISDKSTGIEIPGYVANVRSSDNSVLGVVGNRYKIVQNEDAFDFTDSLIGDEVHYETAGSLREGKTIWLLAQLPKKKILGDDVADYICFTNSHDGTGAIKVILSPIRVVCNNTLNLALKSAQRCWSTKHQGDLSLKLEEAKDTLKFADSYMTQLGLCAEEMYKKKLSSEKVKEFVNELFPCDESATDRQKQNVKEAKDAFMVCYFAPDLANFKGTGWNFVQAASDFATHAKPARMTSTYSERNWERIMNGHPVLDKAMELVQSCV